MKNELLSKTIPKSLIQITLYSDRKIIIYSIMMTIIIIVIILLYAKNK